MSCEVNENLRIQLTVPMTIIGDCHIALWVGIPTVGECMVLLSIMLKF